jgi:hypothetical protein
MDANKPTSPRGTTTSGSRWWLPFSGVRLEVGCTICSSTLARARSIHRGRGLSGCSARRRRSGRRMRWRRRRRSRCSNRDGKITDCGQSSHGTESGWEPQQKKCQPQSLASHDCFGSTSLYLTIFSFWPRILINLSSACGACLFVKMVCFLFWLGIATRPY